MNNNIDVSLINAVTDTIIDAMDKDKLVETLKQKVELITYDGQKKLFNKAINYIDSIEDDYNDLYKVYLPSLEYEVSGYSDKNNIKNLLCQQAKNIVLKNNGDLSPNSDEFKQAWLALLNKATEDYYIATYNGPIIKISADRNNVEVKVGYLSSAEEVKKFSFDQDKFIFESSRSRFVEKAELYKDQKQILTMSGKEFYTNGVLTKVERIDEKRYPYTEKAKTVKQTISCKPNGTKINYEKVYLKDGELLKIENGYFKKPANEDLGEKINDIFTQEGDKLIL